MPPFRTAHSTAESWEIAARECAQGLGPGEAGYNLGFVYVTDVHAGALERILAVLKEATGIAHWVGSVGLGVCTGAEEVFDGPAVAVMIGGFPDEAFRVFPTIATGEGELAPAERAWVDHTTPSFGIVHGDPTNAQTPVIVARLAREVAGFLVGGLTSSRSASRQIADDVTEGGVSGVLFSPAVAVATGLSQGCTPIGAAHVVTECTDNVIATLDDRPALDVFKEDIGEVLARDLNRVAGYIHAAFPVAGSDTGDYVVRNLIGIDPARGWLAVGDLVEPGDRVMFVRRDPHTAAQDLVSMLDKLKRRAGPAPKAGVYISCVARGANMFGAPGREIGMIREALGDFPLVGFYAGGEISNDRLYGYTGVLTLFL